MNELTGEARCVGNQVEYHKLQYLKMSDSAHIWIPSWHNKKQAELQKQTNHRNDEITSPSECCESCFKKFEVDGFK